LALVSAEYCKVVKIVPDPSFVTFVAKLQKAKTRKDKDYYILRTTVPKEIAEEIDAMPGDFLFFKAKKAQWYHMLDWETMQNTWRMLPTEIKQKVVMDGLYGQGVSNQQMQAIGATNLSSIPAPRMLETQIE
jgi:hypothetical protein